MLYDNRFSEEGKSRELELLQNTLSEVDASYSWEQVKKLLQDSVFPWCENRYLVLEQSESRPSPK